MKLRVEKNEFADLIGWAARHTPKRPSVPVLAGVKLTADGATLTVEAFDYEVSAQASMTAVGEDGAALVSARLLAEITKALPNKPVTLETAGAHLVLTCGSGRFTLPTMPVEDYPTLPALPQPVGTVDAAVFAQTVAQAAVAAGRDETLPMMTGVMVEFTGGEVSLLATDRYRLAERVTEWKPAQEYDETLRALVPAMTLVEMAKTLNTGTLTIALTASGQGEGLIGFEAAGRRMTSRLLDGGGYPPVRSLFPAPEAVSTEVTVAVAALAEVVKRVALVAERTTPVLLTFDNDRAVVEAGGTEEARASETLPDEAFTFSGQPITIGFNPQYLLDGLGAVDTMEAHIGFADAHKPAVLSPAIDGAPAGGHRYLMMPIRVSR
ncbi:DNA polymerase III subunit beta [Micromonospora tulbaghiae]|uniref:DNA polymerase III subunit beta n=1 Tax=Micromonospora tulbaghiae TaxID=479978 RepID=UPI0033AC396F